MSNWPKKSKIGFFFQFFIANFTPKIFGLVGAGNLPRGVSRITPDKKRKTSFPIKPQLAIGETSALIVVMKVKLSLLLGKYDRPTNRRTNRVLGKFDFQKGNLFLA